jgi:hypothetical protein
MSARSRSHIYVGVGPRKSLDEKINFINENNSLARRIIKVGTRTSYL